MDTKGYRGKIRKSAKVYTNDSRDKFQYISIEAFIKSSISVSPESVHLEGAAGQALQSTVEIRAERKEPLRLEVSHFDLNEKVAYTIEEVQKGRVYEVHFTNLSKAKETYLGFLNLRTNYSEKPEISIRIRGKFRDQR